MDASSATRQPTNGDGQNGQSLAPPRSMSSVGSRATVASGFVHPIHRTEPLWIGKGRDRRQFDFHRAPEWDDYGFPSLASFQAWAKAGAGLEAMLAITQPETELAA